MFNLMAWSILAVLACGPIVAADDTCQPVIVTVTDQPVAPAAGCRIAAATPPAGCCRVVAFVVGDEDEPRVVGKKVFRLGDEDQEKVEVFADDPERPCIGVTVTPIPEPLAAHIGREGLMIANVVKDSPADHAGLKQYDVVVSFGDRAIAGMDDLLEAVRKAGAGNSVEMVVIRSGEKKKLSITPVRRKELDEWSYKYEPAEPEVDVFKDYFGHRLKIGPRGFGFVWPQGRLRLPDDVKKWLEEMREFEWEEDWPHGRCLPFGFDIEVGTPKAWELWIGDDEDIDAEIEVRIKIREDDQTLIIERDKDGTITVEREDAEGQRSSTTYKNEDELREHDPEAYATYQRLGPARGLRVFWATPDLKDLRSRQGKFELELRRQLRKARQQLDEAVEQAREATRKLRLRLHAIEEEDDDEPSPAGDTEKTVVIFVDDDGRITLEIEEDGASKKYVFDSREQFKRSEPELYERFAEQLEEAGR